jgi:[ribosomal protein S5]-alanine N-acetyltransferase
MEDAPEIPPIANDFLVARWMARRFPYPYTQEDADRWVVLASSDARRRHFAIVVDGILAGGAGVDPFAGERTGTAIFGYWLGRAHWGRGIGTDAAQTLSDHALQSGGLRRLEAHVFTQNVASVRVLEKCGFALEGTLRALYVDRNGAVCDALMFGRVRESPTG